MLSVPAELQQAAEGYPFIQWVNRGEDLEPRQPAGGFAMPADQDSLIDGVRAVLRHSSGSTTPVVYAPGLALAVVASRFAWVKEGMRTLEYAAGARGRLQALCFTATQAGTRLGPIVLTTRGTTSRALNDILKTHRAEVRKMTQGKAPAWFFWTRLQAGKPVLVGHKAKSLVTPLERAAAVSEADFIGEALVKTIGEFADEIRRWPDAWKLAGSGNEEELAVAAVEDDEAPAAVPGTEAHELAQAMGLALPFVSRKYGDKATMGDLFRAQDRHALEWFISNPARYPQHTDAARRLLAELNAAPGPPF
jgi:hypothetical protein